MALSRRSLLALGSVAAVAAAGGVGIWTSTQWWDRPVATGYSCLSTEEAAFFRAFAEATFPPTRSIPVGAADLDLDHFFDAAVAALPDANHNLIRLLLHALDSWPKATRLSSFTALDRDARSAVIDQWANHSRPELRQATSSLLLIAGMGFCTHPKVVPFFEKWHRCGYGR